jgi:hypothetical protein
MKWGKKKVKKWKKKKKKTHFELKKEGGKKTKKEPHCTSLSLMKTKEQNTREYIKNILTPQVLKKNVKNTHAYTNEH